MKPGDLLDGRFELERIAGQGGMSEVFRAIDRVSGEPVAIKVLRVDAADRPERLTREARALAELRHPAIARYVAHGVTATGAEYVAIEWLEGADLRKRLAQRALTIPESVTVVRRIAEGLAVAHARGIIHRDIKPSNVFLIGDDLARAKLFDFGLARWIYGDDPRLTKTGMILGTPSFMSPEQARAGAIDPRADVFSLGCLLFACLIGESPFAGETPVAILAKVLFDEAPRVRELRADVPVELDLLLDRMLAKDPARRPPDAGAVAVELAAIPVDRVDPTLAPPRRRGSAAELTGSEQRLACVVVASGAGAANARAAAAAVERAGAGAGAKLEELADGTLVVLVSSRGAATDQAAQAARCALAMRAVLGEVPVAVATARMPMGEALERAASLLAVGDRLAVRVDDATAGLLGPRFVVAGDAHGLVLRGEREAVVLRARLLGKPTAFAGREAELAMLAALWDECKSAPLPRAVVVTGEEGIGKTRLWHEFAADLLAKGGAVQTFIARADAIRVGSPFALLAQAVRRDAGVVDGEPVAVQRHKLRGRIARHVPRKDRARVVEFLAEMAGVPFAEPSVQLAAARQDATLMGDQIRRAWAEFLAAECAAGPVLIVLEDLHWGDLPSVKLLDHALRSLESLPLLVLALARPEVTELFPRLFAGRRATEIKLIELPRKAAERLVREALGDRLSESDVSAIAEQGAGNPFYLEEIIRSVAARPGEDRGLPTTVLAMVEARLAQQDGEARRVLRAASVFGASFSAGAVAALMGGSARTAQTQDWLDNLVERELVAPHPDAAGADAALQRFAFRHALVREASYATLTEGDRALGHKLAAEWLESAGEHDPAVLAEHYERGGEGAQAVALYLRAAEQALEGNDLAGAVRLAERGLACGRYSGTSGTETPSRRPGEMRGALLLIQVEGHQFSGVIADARRCAIEAAAAYARGSAGWARAIERIVATSVMLGDAESAMPHVAALCETWPAEPSEIHVMAACKTLLPLLVAQRFVLAEALLSFVEAALAKAVQTGPLVAAYADRARAFWAMFHTGDLGEYRARAAAALASFERAGAVRQACQQQGYVAHADILLGHYEDAAAHLAESAVAAERMGLTNVAEAARHNLGYALARTGALDQARAALAGAARAFRTIGDLRMAGNSHVYLSEIEALAGDAPAAEREAREAIAIHAASPELSPLPLAALSRALLLQGKDALALEAARSAMRSLEALPSIEEGETKIRLVFADALLAAGAAAEARAALATARARVLAEAAKIRDAASRESFLTRVPENARALRTDR